MKYLGNFCKLILVKILIFGGTGSFAITLYESLDIMLQQHPLLLQKREIVLAQSEARVQARSTWYPQVSIGLEKSEQSIYPGSGVATTESNEVYSANVKQNLFQGFGTMSAVETMENQYQSVLMDYEHYRQSLLLEGIKIYIDVILSSHIVDLTLKNEAVLLVHLNATKDRFQVGELTRTDIAQSEARYSRAVAERIQAENEKLSQFAKYKRFFFQDEMPTVHVNAQDLREYMPKNKKLPKDLEEALLTAFKSNPKIMAANFARQSAEKNIGVASQSIYPVVDVTGSYRRDGFQASDGSSASIVLSAKIPVFQGFSAVSKRKEAKYRYHGQKYFYEDVVRGVEEEVHRVWGEFFSSTVHTESLMQSVRASEIALEGVKTEFNVGSRTVLDFLDAEKELLDARVELARSQRDGIYSYFLLIFSMGLLDLKIIKG